MLRHNLLNIFRNFKRNKSTFFINPNRFSTDRTFTFSAIALVKTRFTVGTQALKTARITHRKVQEMNKKVKEI